MRCLKRRISDAVYRHLLADTQAADMQAATVEPIDEIGTGPGGHSGASLTSSAVDLPPHIDTSDQPLPGPAASTLPGTSGLAKHHAASAPRPLAPTRQSRPRGAPHRTNDVDDDKRRRTLQDAETALLTTEGSRNDALDPCRHQASARPSSARRA
jgi:hypothetical protein